VAKTRQPEWKKQVDRDMRLYLIWGRTIEHQRNILLTLEMAGTRTIPVYELREGGETPSLASPVEKMAITKDLVARKIEAGLKYRAGMEEMVKFVAAGDPDKETFIRRYWWTAETTVRQRSAMVVAALPFLGHRSWKTGRVGKPTSTFYSWRGEIYEKLGELMGYWTEKAGD